MKILGIGNALVDIVAPIPSDATLQQLNLPKGAMTLVDLDTHNHILELIDSSSATFTTGGSAANTINGLSRLGTQSAFVGKIADDTTGNFFRNDQLASGIEALLLYSTELPSGKCISLVSPCKERTMATYLGAAGDLQPDEITLPACDMIYIEGYLLYNHSLIERIMELAAAQGIKIALDLASYNVVEDNREVIERLIKQYVDLVFANEDEARAYTGKGAEEALEIIDSQCETVVVKIGARGSLLACNGQRARVGVIDATPCDKTGAGDLYAAGFIYGLDRGYSLKTCGDIGAILSSKVIEVMGPKMDDERWMEVDRLVRRVENGEDIVTIFE